MELYIHLYKRFPQVQFEPGATLEVLEQTESENESRGLPKLQKPDVVTAFLKLLTECLTVGLRGIRCTKKGSLGGSPAMRAERISKESFFSLC